MRFVIFITLFLYSASALAATAYEIPGSTVIDLKDKGTSRIYPIFIKLPRSYGRHAQRKYPVIYLTDGPYSFPLVAGATRFPMNAGVMEEAILVAVSYEKGSRGQASRVRDYTPTKASRWKMETGGSKVHANFLENTLFPYIDSHYQTTRQRTYVGNSLGGLFGVYLLFEHPEMFSDYVLGSPSVWFNQDYILSVKPKKLTHSKRVYIAVGQLEIPKFGEQQDMVSGAKALVEKIRAKQDPYITLRFSIIDDAHHSTAFPTTAIQGLHWIHRKK